MKKKTKKLVLAKETVQALDQQDLSAAQGGCVVSNCHCGSVGVCLTNEATNCRC